MASRSRRSVVALVAVVVVGTFLVGSRPVPSTSPTSPFARLVVPASIGLASGPGPGYTPAQIRHAYGIDRLGLDGRGQVVGVVVAYHAATIAEDVHAFSREFGLPLLNGVPGGSPCTVAGGPHPCFQRLTVGGTPADHEDWATEAATSVEWVHAIAPGADILLIETPTAVLADALTGIDVAVANGAGVVSLSWTTAEFPEETAADTHFRRAGVDFFAATGDVGPTVSYPAASPHVVAVGGTTLALDDRGEVRAERLWIGSGRGVSAYETARTTQPGAAVGRRVVPDVVYAADPRPGYLVLNSSSRYGRAGWLRQGGTSVGTPQWAAIAALARQAGWSSNGREAGFAASLDVAGSKAWRDQNFRPVATSMVATCLACASPLDPALAAGLGAPRVDRLVPFLAQRLAR